jgi:hypothetical protein
MLTGEPGPAPLVKVGRLQMTGRKRRRGRI